MKNIEKLLVIVMFIAVIVAVPILTFNSEIAESSDIEFRELAKEPEYSNEDFWNGSFFREWENYFLDHIYERNQWLKINTAVQMKLLKRDVINSVVVTDDVLLAYNYPNEEPYDLTEDAEEIAERLAGANERTKAYGGTFLYVSMPEQFSIFRDRYPSHLENGGRLLDAIDDAFTKAMSEKDVPFLNMRREFLAQEDYDRFYALTDHHYNFRGAVFTCQAIERRLREMGTDISLALPGEKELQGLDNRFQGSRNRQLSYLSPLYDKFLYYTPTIPFKRWDQGNPSQEAVINFPITDDDPVSYVNYMFGDIAETLVATYRDDLPNVLIWGDSFTNAAETMLYTGFNEMRSLDLRFYKTMGVYEYIETYKPDIVICMVNDANCLALDGNGDIH